MFARRLLRVSHPPQPSICLRCARPAPLRLQTRPFSVTAFRLKSKSKTPEGDATESAHGESSPTRQSNRVRGEDKSRASLSRRGRRKPRIRTRGKSLIRKIQSVSKVETKLEKPSQGQDDAESESKSLKEALLEGKEDTVKAKKHKSKADQNAPTLPIEVLSPHNLDFEPIEHEIPPVPRLSHGLDRVLFNPGVYRLQDPRSRVYNFDPYLEKIMPVTEFDFDALSEYKTSSKDEDLLAMTRRLGTRFTGSTSSMSGILQHFHFLLSKYRKLNHDMLSRKFPAPSERFSQITRVPSAIFLRRKSDLYAIDADKSYDSPNIMSWLGHSLEKLLTNSRDEFERYRRSSPESAPNEDDSGKCFHYSKLGNFLMRSQLDAHDSRLPGTGIFDLKTRAVVSIRMDHTEYETGAGYQLRYDRGEWESFEREFYDMSRATMLKYSLQVRMGRMDGIFVAYHNVERMFGFQYVSLPDMDNVLHGQADTCLGDQEFKLSIRLLDEMLQRATKKFPDTTIRLHFDTRDIRQPFMYVFAEPVTEEQADALQNSKSEVRKEFERDVIGVARDDPEVQAEWQDIQGEVDEEMDGERMTAQDGNAGAVAREERPSTEENGATENQGETTPAEPASEGPLMGWTLAVRNIVNGAYVDRPENLRPSDNWTIEYHIKEIPEEKQRTLYDKTKKTRETLLGKTRDEQSSSLRTYREMIKRYSKSGRLWREEQDRIDEQIGKRIYRPLGPESEEGLEGLGTATAQGQQ